MTRALRCLALAFDDSPLTWILAGAACYALLGFGFGALVYHVGRRGGGRFGSALIDQLGSLPPSTRRTLAAGIDGALFVGLIGLVLGMVAGRGGIVFGFVALAALMACTMVFAGLAQNLTGRRNPLVTALCTALIGILVGFMVSDGKFVGAAIGCMAGLLVSPFVGGRRPSAPPPADTELEPDRPAADE